MKNLKFFDWIALLLVIIGGLNWGLVGFFGFNLVEAIFGNMTTVIRVIYAVVGLASVYILFICAKLCRKG